MCIKKFRIILQFFIFNFSFLILFLVFLQQQTRVTADLLFEYTGEMKLSFEAENVAEFFNGDMRIFFDKINDMIHFVMQKCLAGRHIEIKLTCAVQ